MCVVTGTLQSRRKSTLTTLQFYRTRNHTRSHLVCRNIVFQGQQHYPQHAYPPPLPTQYCAIFLYCMPSFTSSCPKACATMKTYREHIIIIARVGNAPSSALVGFTRAAYQPFPGLTPCPLLILCGPGI
ncbi:unnamed protein product [Chondrus crispus]|uniref:Uncharacterized protein n=1 Tax=Chondrus crispus TaxID=2769 RepID=R7Q8P4_CHOCR|nr:unnamed protein product [Chondrus crispus]CDF34404.1 unnamed protein product [Chondrus crispus]|eukprot:XP_005714223.1 unnamed protein product [Chondrus crispus]